jgi:hypothetical protein
LAFVIALLYQGRGVDLGQNLFPINPSDWSITGVMNMIRSNYGDMPFSFKYLTLGDPVTSFSLLGRLTPISALFIVGSFFGTVIGLVLGPIGAAVGLLLGGILFIIVF